MERIGWDGECGELPVLQEDFAAVAAAAEGDLGRLAGSTLLVVGADGLLGGGVVRALAWCRRYGLPAPERLLAVVDAVRPGDAPASPALGEGVEVFEIGPGAPLPDGIEAQFAVLAPGPPEVADPADPLLAIEGPTARLRRVLAWAERQPRLEGLLLVSDADVYGSLPTAELPVAEDARPGRLGPIQAAGAAAAHRYCEALALAAARGRGVPVRVARAFHVFGPGLGLDSGTVIADFLRDRLAGGPIRLRADGDRVRSFCYLADALGGLLGVLVRGRSGEVFNLGNDRETVTVAELARMVARIEPPRLRAVPLETPPPARLAESPRRLVPDCSRARHLLGYTPRVSLPEGLRRTLRWLREAGLAAEAPLPERVSASDSALVPRAFASMRRPCTSVLRPLRPEPGAPGRSKAL